MFESLKWFFPAWGYICSLSILLTFITWEIYLLYFNEFSIFEIFLCYIARLSDFVISLSEDAFLPMPTTKMQRNHEVHKPKFYTFSDSAPNRVYFLNFLLTFCIFWMQKYLYVVRVKILIWSHPRFAYSWYYFSLGNVWQISCKYPKIILKSNIISQLAVKVFVDVAKIDIPSI